MEKANKKIQKNLKNILIGCTISMIITCISCLILATILINTNISETIIPISIIVIYIISVLIGSSISSIKTNRKGIINGGLVGIIYISIIYILSSITLAGFKLNMYSIIIIIGSIISGMIGGIIGVNLNKK